MRVLCALCVCVCVISDTQRKPSTLWLRCTAASCSLLCQFAACIRPSTRLHSSLFDLIICIVIVGISSCSLQRRRRGCLYHNRCQQLAPIRPSPPPSSSSACRCDVILIISLIKLGTEGRCWDKQPRALTVCRCQMCCRGDGVPPTNPPPPPPEACSPLVSFTQCEACCSTCAPVLHCVCWEFRQAPLVCVFLL